MYNMNQGFYNFNPMYNSNMMYYSMPRQGLFKRMFGNFNFSNFLTQTSKTLNVVNQAIPIIYQVKPLVNNAKTMLRIANIIKSDDTNSNLSSINNSSNENNNHNINSDSNKKEEYGNSFNGPTFFL